MLKPLFYLIMAFALLVIIGLVLHYIYDFWMILALIAIAYFIFRKKK